MEESTLFSKSLEILAKSPENRDISDLKILEKITEKSPFFLKLFSKYRQIAYKLLRNLKVKVLKRGKTLFFVGDFPDNFYIILKGSVFVLIPKDFDLIKLEKTEESDKIRDFLDKMRFEAISPEKPSFSSFLLKNPQVSFNLMKNSSIFKGNSAFYHKKELFSDFEILDLEKPWLFFEEGVFKYNCINMLNFGQSFGELGLLTKKPRNATILCKEDTFLLYLEKNDYMMVELIDRAKILKKIRFFSQYFFRNLTTNDYLSRMIYNFQKRKYAFGHKIYEENGGITGCFLIKKGVILLKKKTGFSKGKKNDKSDKNMMNFKRKKAEKTEEIEIASFEKGHFVGEDDIMCNRKFRSYSAVSKSADLVVFFIQKELFLQILKDKPLLHQYFTEISSSKSAFFLTKLEKTNEESPISLPKPKAPDYVRTEEEDLNSSQISPKTTLSTKNSSKTPQNTSFKRNGFWGNLARNTSFLRGKLFEKAEKNQIEINSNKTKNQKIIEIMKKNEISKKEKSAFSIENNAIIIKKHNSMIRSPLNKYSFIKIDENQMKTGIFIGKTDRKIQLKTPIFSNEKNKGITEIQQRIQSSKGGISHKRVNSAINYQGEIMDFITSPNKRRNSSNEIKGLLSNNEKNVEKTLKRRLSSTIYSTKHNMFFFMKKAQIYEKKSLKSLIF